MKCDTSKTPTVFDILPYLLKPINQPIMKKITFFLSMFLCFMLGTMTANAQIWVDGDGSAALGTESSGQYTYHSGNFTPSTNPSKLRLVFLDTSTGNKDTSGRHPYVHFAEFYLYDANGNRVTLTTSNFSSNATETAEGGLDQLCNDVTSGASNKYDWYWHSTWSSTPNCDHYLEIAVPDDTDLTTFSYGYISRNTGCIPTKVMLIAGTDKIAAHDNLNTIEQKLEHSNLSTEGKAFSELATAKAAFEEGNTDPDLSEINQALSDMNQTVMPLIHTLSIASDLTDASGPARKAYDGSGSTFTIPAGTSKVRMTVTNTNTGQRHNNHVYFTLSELIVNLNGSALNLADANLTTNADQNSLGSTDGGGLSALYDNNYNTFFHSAYQNGPAADHYLEFDLPSALTADGTMYISFNSRNNNNVPTVIEFSNPDDVPRYAALAALYTRIDELKGKVGTGMGQYDESAIASAAEVALAVFRNSASTTEQINAALTQLNSDAEKAVILFADNTKVMLGNKDHTTTFVYANTASNLLCNNSNKNSYAYVWTLKKVGAQTYKFYNEYADKYIGAVPDVNNQRFPMVDEADACVFTVAAKSAGYFNIYDATFTPQDRSVLHATNWDGVVRWNFDANASQFSFITDIAADCTAFDNALIARVNGMVGTKYGQVKSLSSEINAAIAALQENSSVTNYKNLEAAILTAEYVLPEAGKIYRIVSGTEASDKRNPDDLVYANPVAVGTDRFTAATDRQIKHTVTTSDTDTKATLHAPDSYWKFEKATANNLVYVRHLNSGLYIGQLPSNNCDAQLPLSKDDAGQYSFTWLTASENYMLYDIIGRRYLHSSNAGEKIIGYDVASENASRWTIEEVTSVPVKISAVKYATLHLPFAVEIPANVEAYIGKEEAGGAIQMEPLSGVIPANTAVVLVSTEDLTEAKTYDFNVAYGNEAATPANVLSGTTTAETVADEAVAYILKNGTTGVGLYKVNSETDRTIPANKAYFGSTVAAGLAPAMYSFRFGEQTSIEGVNAAGNENESYYDLNGRRVLYPAHGVFVKSNGQKVYVK